MVSYRSFYYFLKSILIIAGLLTILMLGTLGRFEGGEYMEILIAIYFLKFIALIILSPKREWLVFILLILVLLSSSLSLYDLLSEFGWGTKAIFNLDRNWIYFIELPQILVPFILWWLIKKRNQQKGISSK